MDKFCRPDFTEPIVNDVEVRIEWDLRNLTQEQKEKLFKVEEILSEIGVSFDTGAGGGVRDWEWDWSLKGPVRVKFVRMTVDNKKNRYDRMNKG